MLFKLYLLREANYSAIGIIDILLGWYVVTFTPQWGI